MPTALALGLDPVFVKLPNNPELTPEIVRASVGYNCQGKAYV